MESIAGFILVAAIMTMLLEYPGSPLQRTLLIHYPLLRRTILGLVLGIYILLITLWAGKKSGAHANSMISLAFYRLNKISLKDVCAYIIAQFAGAVLAVGLLSLFLHKCFGDPSSDYSRAKPQPPHGLMESFVTEFLISFIFVSAVLFSLTAKKLEKYAGAIMGLLIALFIIIELPYSGMSMNPARSFSGALAAGNWDGLWIYFVSPVMAMLLACELFLMRQRNIQALDPQNRPIIHADHFFGSLSLSTYPL